jgi:hypothetical protein
LAAESGVQISQLDGKLRVEINGQLFTEYHYQDVPRPYFYPVLGADELAVTRKWPMEDTKDEEAWRKRADWCDYCGPVGGKTVGVAIFDHPDNPRHPTWWHVRDYGLFAANPFGIHDFEKKPKGTGDSTLPAGQSITFRYRFYFHRGNETQARVAERYQEYVRSKPKKD